MHFSLAVLGMLLFSFSALSENLLGSVLPKAIETDLRGAGAPTVGKVLLAKSATAPEYSTSGTRDAWCPERAHFCIGADETKSIPKITRRYVKPVPPKFMVETNGGKCTSKRFPKEVTGIIVQLYNFKKKVWQQACQPLPRNAAESFVIALEPGKKHRQNLIAESSYPIEFIGAPRPKENQRDMRPIINCFDTIKDSNVVRSKSCTGLQKGTKLTIDGFVIIAGIKDAAGKWRVAGTRNYRCILGNVQKLVVKNVDAKGCPHGIQNSAAMALFSQDAPEPGWKFKNGEWHIYNSRFTDCSPRGDGLKHCVYSNSPHALVKIRGFYGTSCGGHVVKSNSRRLDMQEFHIQDIAGPCNVNSPIHNNSGREVRLVNGTIVQNDQPKKTNLKIFTSGGKTKRGYRCTGKTNGHWFFKNITVVDKESKPYSPKQHAKYYKPRHTNLCDHLPNATFEDGSGNTFHWLDKDRVELLPVLRIIKKRTK